MQIFICILPRQWRSTMFIIETMSSISSASRTLGYLVIAIRFPPSALLACQVVFYMSGPLCRARSRSCRHNKMSNLLIIVLLEDIVQRRQRSLKLGRQSPHSQWRNASSITRHNFGRGWNNASQVNFTSLSRTRSSFANLCYDAKDINSRSSSAERRCRNLTSGFRPKTITQVR